MGWAVSLSQTPDAGGKINQWKLFAFNGIAGRSLNPKEALAHVLNFGFFHFMHIRIQPMDFFSSMTTVQ